RRLSYSGPGILLILGLQQVRRRPARRSAPLNCRQISKRNLCVCDIHRLPSSSRRDGVRCPRVRC
ncbi:hypothetical protein GW17_00038256, partial [Ensete ventricosum]